MALIGTGLHSVDIKLFDNDISQDWDAAWTLDEVRVIAGQGFEFPDDTTWVNKPTGDEAQGGMVMGFPRSVEPQSGQGGQPWYVTES